MAMLRAGVLLGVLASVMMPGRLRAGEDEASASQDMWVHVTFYLPTGNPTYSGEMPYDGSAGCSQDIPLGTVLEFDDGSIVRCNDRGLDGFMAPHIDRFCAYSYAQCESFPGVGNWLIPQHATVLEWG